MIKQNKKGQHDAFTGIVSLLFIMGMCAIFTIVFPMKLEKTDCSNMSNLTLIQINGMKDMDTGLLAGGTTKQKNLLFNNGLSVTLEDDKISRELYLNGSYDLGKCKSISSCFIKTSWCIYKEKWEYELK
jgi:hypothetical protein